MKEIDLNKKKEEIINNLFEVKTVGKKGIGLKETKVIDRLFNLIDFTAVYDIKIYLHEAIDKLLSQQKEELEKAKIKKLKLKSGDILQVMDRELALDLSEIGTSMGLPMDIPIIIGDIRKLNKSDLEYLKGKL